MSSQEKRYRFQIQFDLFADSDKEAVQEVLDIMYEMRDVQNPNIIWMAENPFASFHNREIDHNEIESELFEEEQQRIEEIKNQIPF